MTATYFNRNHTGHSIRGTVAREQGAMAWSKLPANLRKGITSAQAEALVISTEWHHAGKHADRVSVYYPEQVQAFWDTLGEAMTAGELKEHANNRIKMRLIFPAQDQQVALVAAREAAETVRQEITGETT